MEKKLLNPTAYNFCTIYVATYGLENCSKTFNRVKIKSLIENAEKVYNINVVYLAANQDAFLKHQNMVFLEIKLLIIWKH
jgi:hypothetical protein